MDNVITKDSALITEFEKKIEQMDGIIDIMQNNNFCSMEKWVIGEKLMKIFGISKRSLQNYRDTGILPYSMIGGKIYYNMTDIEELFRKNYINMP